VRSTIGAISSNGRLKTSCITNARRSAGPSVSSTTSKASPTESAISASCSGSSWSAGPTIGSGMRTSSDSSRRAWRERSMLRLIRATTVVSQPPMFSTSVVSVRSNRIQASCTASSASVVEPSMR